MVYYTYIYHKESTIHVGKYTKCPSSTGTTDEDSGRSSKDQDVHPAFLL